MIGLFGRDAKFCVPTLDWFLHNYVLTNPFNLIYMKSIILYLLLFLVAPLLSMAQLITNNSNPQATPAHVTANYNITAPASLDDNTEKEYQLEQASPNPAKEYTWIPYNLPSGVNNAQIVLRNLLGNEVSTLIIDANEQRVRLNTSSLNHGIYIYSLVINNQTVKSKRLLVAN